MASSMLCALLLGCATAWAPAAARCKSLSKRTVAPSTADYVADQLGRDNYANLAMQLGMLEDEARMDAYRVAIASEPKIKGGVVLDVGAGSGVLSVLCAKAGATRRGVLLRGPGAVVVDGGRLSFAQKPGEYFLASVELDEADGVDVDVEELEVELDDDDDDDDEDALDYDDDDFDEDDDLDDDLDDADLVGLDELRWYLSNYD
ncbi:protein arginine N-methyltransferase-like protein [Aureococcus anophagefferens]|nr:protein arginine N-methyltransferase-like protein [Aureococcus anophagefferens]